MKLKYVAVLIAPIKIVPLPDRLIYLKDKTPKFPYWYFAILDRQGKLSISEELFPIFQRRFLEPLADERTEFIFSTVEKVDLATAIGKEKYDSYAEYIDSINEIFKRCVGQSLETYQIEGYIVVKNGIVLLPDEDINAGIGIIQLYEKLLNEKSLPKLLSTFIELQNNTEKPPLTVSQFIESNSLHLGQMGFNFSLSLSQRRALYTLLQLQSPVFAVNGPPGTGKTSLIQSLVANKIVESALNGASPPIILACSTNNQAVTNIIDSFSKSNERTGALQGRWLHDIEGYATFLPANNKSEAELKGINYKKQNDEGLFKKIENLNYINEAKNYYLQKGADYFNSTLLSIEDVIQGLQNEIKELNVSLNNATRLWKEYLQKEELFLSDYLSEGADRARYYIRGLLNDSALDIDITTLTKLEKEILLYFKNESFFRKLFCFLGIKLALRNRDAEIKIILRGSLISDIKQLELTKAGILEKINKKIETARKLIRAISDWKDWKRVYEIKGNPAKNESEYLAAENIKIETQQMQDLQKSKQNGFYDELDITLRHQAFQLAVHYWEGRWLMAIEGDLMDPNFERKGTNQTINRWTRQAMITPCFVSTFYMAPKFFSSYKFLQKGENGKNIYDNPPLLEFIDLLIVDEAGQVSPEVGIATFALAKQAVIVGDIKQIEPVWNIISKVDIGNLRREGLINNYEDSIFEEQYDPKGFLASSGSIMKMAQNASIYKEKGSGEKGVLLVEHRRCYDEIISYCNVLAYNGQLKPLKGKADKSNPFPPMYCIHVEGNSSLIHSSRQNLNEVKAIVNWLLNNRSKIEEKYGKVENAVGIITPFVGQKNSLRFELRKVGIDTDLMKIGTVHALQGAEKHIVLFSMVYGKGDSASMFFDRGNKPNMLNVAVSRAKDSFIVFANTDIFDKDAKTPSGILSNFLSYDRPLIS